MECFADSPKRLQKIPGLVWVSFCVAFPSVSTYLLLPFLTCLQLEICGDLGLACCFFFVVVVDNGE